MNKVVDRLVEGAKAFDEVKKDCRGFESYNISPSGEVQVYLSLERFLKLFDLYKIRETLYGTYLFREIDGVVFLTDYDSIDMKGFDDDDDF